MFLSLFFVQGAVKDPETRTPSHGVFYQNYIKILPHWWPRKAFYILLETNDLQREQNFQILNSLTTSASNTCESGSPADNNLPFSVLKTMENRSQTCFHHPPYRTREILLDPSALAA